MTRAVLAAAALPALAWLLWLAAMAQRPGALIWLGLG